MPGAQLQQVYIISHRDARQRSQLAAAVLRKIGSVSEVPAIKPNAFSPHILPVPAMTDSYL